MVRRGVGWRRRRWAGALVAALVVLAGTAVAATPPTLRALHTRVAPDGRTLLVELSAPTAARVQAVERSGGGLARLYVDLPPGSRVDPAARRLAGAEAPLAGARVGQADDGSVRLVLDLERAQGWRLRREDGGRTVAITVTRARAVERRPTDAAAATAPPAAPAPAVVAAASASAAAAKPATTVAPTSAAPRAAAVEAARSDPDTAPPVAEVDAAPTRLAHRATPGRPRIVLDPGHGGTDPGATGYVVEKELTLDLAQQVATLLRARGADVVLTRTDDSTVPLSARTARANAEQPDLFVSIHANANPGGTLQGIETYVLDDSTDHAVLRLASMENGLDMLHPPDGGQTDLRYILSDLVQGGKMEESTALAGAIQKDLVRTLRRQWSGVTDLGVKRGPFYVLVGAYMPCVLVEVSFLTHPTEGRRLLDPAYRADIAHGIAAGIGRFLGDDARTRTL